MIKRRGTRRDAEGRMPSQEKLLGLTLKLTLIFWIRVRPRVKVRIELSRYKHFFQG